MNPDDIDIYRRHVQTFSNDLMLAGPEFTARMRDACAELARTYLPAEDYPLEKFTKLFCEHFYALESSLAQNERIDQESIRRGRVSPARYQRKREETIKRMESELARATRFWVTVFAATRKHQSPEKA